MSTLKQSATQRVIIYGAPETGKTQLALSLAERFNVLYIGIENGHSTGYKLPIEWQERINVINLPDSRVFPIGVETVLKFIKGTATNICVEHGKVECQLCKKDSSKPWELVHLDSLDGTWVVVFDSLTQLTNSAISHITKGKPDDYKLDYDDWAMLGKLMDMFLSQIQQAGYNIVCVSHEMEVEMEDGRKKLVPVCGTSKFSRNVSKYFDHTVYAEIKNRKHIFSSSSTGSMQAVAGSRTGIELEKMEKPSLLAIFKYPTETEILKTAGEIKAEAAVSEAKNELEEAVSKVEEAAKVLQETPKSTEAPKVEVQPQAEQKPQPSTSSTMSALEKLKLLKGKQ